MTMIQKPMQVTQGLNPKRTAIKSAPDAVVPNTCQLGHKRSNHVVIIQMTTPVSIAGRQ